MPLRLHLHVSLSAKGFTIVFFLEHYFLLLGTVAIHGPTRASVGGPIVIDHIFSASGPFTFAVFVKSSGVAPLQCGV